MGDISFKAVHLILLDWVLENIFFLRISGRLTGLPFGPSSPGGPLAPAGPAAPGGPASPFSPLSPLGPYSVGVGEGIHHISIMGHHFFKHLHWIEWSLKTDLWPVVAESQGWFQCAKDNNSGWLTEMTLETGIVLVLHHDLLDMMLLCLYSPGRGNLQ